MGGCLICINTARRLLCPGTTTRSKELQELCRRIWRIPIPHDITKKNPKKILIKIKHIPAVCDERNRIFRHQLIKSPPSIFKPSCPKKPETPVLRKTRKPRNVVSSEKPETTLYIMYSTTILLQRSMTVVPTRRLRKQGRQDPALSAKVKVVLYLLMLVFST